MSRDLPPVAVRARRMLAALGAGLVVAGPLSGCDRTPPPPNVLLISVDTLRADYLGTGGDPSGTTPHLDRLARRGVHFVDALSTTSWTLPSHMSLLTGQYPSSHGVIGDGRALVSEKRTLAEYLKARGYATGGFVSGPYLHRAYGFDQGFDVYRHCAAWGAELNEKGRVSNVIGVNIRSHSGVTNPGVHEAVDEWLGDVRRGPWFLFVHYWDPHYDFEPPSPWDEWLDPEWSGRFDPRGFLANPGISADMPAENRRRLLDLYRGEIRWTDAWIGRLLDRIAGRGELGRTIVIVVGDHGEEFFEHGEKGHRNNLYDETLRVPLIVRAPEALEGGRVVDGPASLVDVPPTVLARLGEPRPADQQGVDLAAGPPARAVLAELHQEIDSVIEGPWKLVYRWSDGRTELYDRAADPGERVNLAESRPEVRDRLLGILRSGDHARFSPNRTEVPVLDARTEEELRALGYTD